MSAVACMFFNSPSSYHPEAAVLSAIDYKITFAKRYNSEDEGSEATSQCHSRSAKRVLKALLANGGQFRRSGRYALYVDRHTFKPGIFIKLGQHMASL